jgi:hypothetical protein
MLAQPIANTVGLLAVQFSLGIARRHSWETIRLQRVSPGHRLRVGRGDRGSSRTPAFGDHSILCPASVGSRPRSFGQRRPHRPSPETRVSHEAGAPPNFGPVPTLGKARRPHRPRPEARDRSRVEAGAQAKQSPAPAPALGQHPISPASRVAGEPGAVPRLKPGCRR